MKHTSSFLFAASFIALAACSSSKTDTTPGSSGTVADGGADSGELPSGGTQCTAARDQTLIPIGKVSTGQVKVVKTEGTVTTLYIDASAGGTGSASKTPRVYVHLGDNARVDLTDKAAFESADWDLALKRSVLYTNSADTGIGKGGGAQIKKGFDAVTVADADAAEIKPEKIFDDNCVVANKDAIGAPVTTFTDWYIYDTKIRGPAPNLTFIVRSADGAKRYKVGIASYYGKPDGTEGDPESDVGGTFLLKVAPL